MEQLLNEGASVCELGSLRMLQLVHSQTSALVEDLKGHELPTGIPRSPVDTSDFRRSTSGSAVTVATSGAALGSMLDNAMEELFATYTEGQRYLDRESKCLTELYSKLLRAFARYHV
jgi:exocyst complex component 5